jgi:hypothetical protein
MKSVAQSVEPWRTIALKISDGAILSLRRQTAFMLIHADATLAQQ